MIERLKRLWRRQPILLVALAAALAIFSFFGVQLAAEAIYWNDPAHRQQALEPWMTPRYVSHSYKIPPDMLLPALGIERGNDDGDNDIAKGRLTLRTIAAQKGMTLSELQELVDELAEEAEENREEKRND